MITLTDCWSAVDKFILLWSLRIFLFNNIPIKLSIRMYTLGKQKSCFMWLTINLYQVLKCKTWSYWIQTVFSHSIIIIPIKVTDLIGYDKLRHSSTQLSKTFSMGIRNFQTFKLYFISYSIFKRNQNISKAIFQVPTFS